MLVEKYGAEKVLSSEKPMLAIAEGAAILAHSLPISDVEEDEDDIPAVPAPEETVVYTTKRVTFIEVLNDENELEYEKIIDPGEVLPLEKNKRFFTSSDNQKIVEVKLFTEKEDGSYEKVTTGFFTISEDLPKGSDILFSFTVDLDEVMNIKVRIDATGKTQAIVLGRGKFDSACLNDMSKSIREVLSSNDLRPEDKRDFIAEVQKKIDRINAGRMDEMDPEWNTIQEDLARKKPNVPTRDPNAVYFIIAQILLNVFGEYLSPGDSNQLRSLVDDYETTHNANHLASMKTICNNYGLLTQVYLYNILADKATDSDVATKSARLYKQMMNDLSNHNLDAINVTLDMNDEWLHENLKRFNASISVAGTDVGKKTE